MIENACGILVGKPEVEGPLGRPKCTTVINNKMNLRGTEWCGLD
jgi:hypothetical protein